MRTWSSTCKVCIRCYCCYVIVFLLLNSVGKDVRSVVYVLTVIAILLGFFAIICALLLSFDWAVAILQFYTRIQKSDSKLPRSTRYLLFQSIVLSFLTMSLLCVLIPTTIIVRRHSANVIFANHNDIKFVVNIKYWNYGFREYPFCTNILIYSY